MHKDTKSKKRSKTSLKENKKNIDDLKKIESKLNQYNSTLKYFEVKNDDISLSDRRLLCEKFGKHVQKSLDTLYDLKFDEPLYKRRKMSLCGTLSSLLDTNSSICQDIKDSA